MNNQPIGIIDSGIGGLSIWREIVKQLPHESTFYLADSANCPYGNKSNEEIYKLSKRLIKLLIEKNVKVIVIACNTITVSCISELRVEFKNLPIVGTVPVIKTAGEITKNGRIGVLSTKNTAKSRYQKNLIEKFAGRNKVINIGTDKLVPFVEKGKIEGEYINTVLKDELQPFIKENIDVLALGCTHFPFLKDKMQKVLGENVKIIDSSGALARQVKRVLKANNTLSTTIASHEFYTTGDMKVFKHTIEKLLGKETVKMVKLGGVNC